MNPHLDIDCRHNAGVVNPKRWVRLMHDTIDLLELDLSGLTVLTEAASHLYAVTPVIAAMAGAERVFAITRDSAYATVESVSAQTRALEKLCDVEERVEIHTRRMPALFARADIVTNLGFVRPIDAAAVSVMKPTAVVSLMCETWEIRPGDVDLKACADKGIVVLGTNEDFPGLEVFTYSGWLALKLLFEAQIEIHKSRVVVVSRDKFGKVIQRQLQRIGVLTHLVADLRMVAPSELADADALFIADYTRNDVIIGPDGDMTASELADLAPSITVVQFAGRLDLPSMVTHGLTVYPHTELSAHRMAITLAGLGPRPVIELHSAGLKVGQWAHDIRKSGADPVVSAKSGSHTLAQAIDR